MAWLTAAIALAAAAFYGGWEWTLISLLVLTVLWRTDFRAASISATVVPGLCWLALYQWTGDRRLFFPYSMQYAVQMMALTGPPARRAFRSVTGGASVVLVFVLIRIIQSAAAGVLLVELLVAAAVLSLATAVYGQGRRGVSPSDTTARAMARAMLAALGSLLAYAGLAF